MIRNIYLKFEVDTLKSKEVIIFCMENPKFNERQEPCQHGHPPSNVFAHWKNVYVVQQNNSILRGILVMKTDGYSDYKFETYVKK
jgi:hypothetical protein